MNFKREREREKTGCYASYLVSDSVIYKNLKFLSNYFAHVILDFPFIIVDDRVLISVSAKHAFYKSNFY